MASTQAIRVKALYEGTRTPPKDDVVIVVKEGFIEAILSGADEAGLQAFSVSHVLDKRDCYASPGLIDVHTHLMLPGDGRLTETILRDYTTSQNVLMARQNAEQSLSHGITSLRDCGTARGVALSLRDFIRAGGWNGPDIVAAGMPMTSTCGHCVCMGGGTDGEEALRSLLRQQWFDGIDFCKIMASAGGTLGVHPGLTFRSEELHAIVDEAHRLGMSVTIHATEIDAVRAAVKAGADRIEHAYFMDYSGENPCFDKDLAAAIVDAGILVCHTLPVIASSLDAMAEQGLGPENHAPYRFYEGFQSNVEALFRFHVEQGVPFAAGSDAGWRNCTFADAMLKGMKIMEQNGVHPRDVLTSATADAARYIGREKTLGRLAPGYQADIVLTRSDPGQSVDALRDVAAVFKRGEAVLASDA